MCVDCIRSQVDITEGIQKQLTIYYCRNCDRSVSVRGRVRSRVRHDRVSIIRWSRRYIGGGCALILLTCTVGDCLTGLHAHASFATTITTPKTSLDLSDAHGLALSHSILSDLALFPSSRIGTHTAHTPIHPTPRPINAHRYLQPPNQYVACDLESRELLALCLKRLKLNKVRLVDAGFIWTEPHSKRIKVKVVIQKEVCTKLLCLLCFG